MIDAVVCPIDGTKFEVRHAQALAGVIGKIRRNDHASRTGFLAIEGAVNAAAVDYSLK